MGSTDRGEGISAEVVLMHSDKFSTCIVQFGVDSGIRL